MPRAGVVNRPLPKNRNASPANQLRGMFLELSIINKAVQQLFAESRKLQQLQQNVRTKRQLPSRIDKRTVLNTIKTVMTERRALMERILAFIRQYVRRNHTKPFPPGLHKKLLRLYSGGQA